MFNQGVIFCAYLYSVNVFSNHKLNTSVMKLSLKYLALFLCMAALLAACKKNNNIDTFDYTAQYKLDTTAIRNFVVTNNIPAVKDSASGIFYQVLAPGTGTLAYQVSTKISVNYVGKLLNGTSFDSTAVGSPMVRALGDLIPGFQFGVTKIQKGGKVRVLIPSYYGYGNQPLGPIPANSVLDFTIELLDAL
jgi:FKBP-type peptidyl-prolyl cis-trans isomerase FkpA